MLRLLLARGADPCNATPAGVTALHAACAQQAPVTRCAAVGQAPTRARQPPLALKPSSRPPAASSNVRQGQPANAAAAVSRHGARSGSKQAMPATAIGRAAAAAGADVTVQRSGDSLLLAVEQGGEAGLALARAMLQQGLTGQLSDELTAQVVACLPDLQAVQAAANAASSQHQHQPLSFEALLAARLFRTAVAYLLKSKGIDARAQDAASGDTLLHGAVSGADDLPEFVSALMAAGVPAGAANKEHADTPLHIAARLGHIGACRALVAGGADVLRRNGKNRTPGSQLKLPEAVEAFLREAEAAARAAKDDQRRALYDAKMRATQTQSSCALSTL